MTKMSKKDLMSELSTATGIGQTLCEAVLTAAVKIITKQTLDDDVAVPIQGFGTFSANHKQARTCRNPKTGADVQVAAKTVLKFKPVASLVKEG